MKCCSKCLEIKPFSAFMKRKGATDGYRGVCRDCKYAAARARYANDPERHREYFRTYYKEKNFEASAVIRKKYRAKYPERTKANSALNTAIRRGLAKKQLCWVCGAAKAQGHHASYHPSAQLDVVWLCRTHHKAAHDSR
jgi:hypothetical protein